MSTVCVSWLTFIAPSRDGVNTLKKWLHLLFFFVMIFFVLCSEYYLVIKQETVNLVTFTEEIPNGKHHCLCSGCVTKIKDE